MSETEVKLSPFKFIRDHVHAGRKYLAGDEADFTPSIALKLANHKAGVIGNDKREFPTPKPAEKIA